MLLHAYIPVMSLLWGVQAAMWQVLRVKHCLTAMWHLMALCCGSRSPLSSPPYQIAAAAAAAADLDAAAHHDAVLQCDRTKPDENALASCQQRPLRNYPPSAACNNNNNNNQFTGVPAELGTC